MSRISAIQKCQELMRIAGPLGFTYKIPVGPNPEAEHSLNRRWRGTLAKILTSVDFKSGGFKPSGEDAVRFILVRRGILWELRRMHRIKPESFDKRFRQKAKLLSELQDALCSFSSQCHHEWTRNFFVSGSETRLRIGWNCLICNHKEFISRELSEKVLKETASSFLERKTHG